MSFSKITKPALAVMFGAIAIIGLASSTAHAAEQHPVHLQVSPTSQHIALDPGSEYTGSFKVQNVGTEQFTYKVYATPYTVVNERYDVTYNQPNNYTQISEWVTFSRTAGTLEPGTETEITYTVSVPNDVPSGGQYAALMAETEDGNSEDANMKVVNRVGMVLYSSVAGDTRREGTIINNDISSFMFKSPISATSLVENTGNVDATAYYTLKVWPLSSSEEVYSNEDAPVEKIVLPDTKRFNTISWEDAPNIGIFHVEQTISFLDQTSVNKKLVIICPLWLIFLILFIILAIVFWLVSRHRARKSNHGAKGSEAARKHNHKEDKNA